MLIVDPAIGLLTPPVRSVLFVGCAIGQVTIGEAVRKMGSFYLALLVALAPAANVSGMSLWPLELLTR